MGQLGELPPYTMVIPSYGERGVSLTRDLLESYKATHGHIKNAEVFISLDGDADISINEKMAKLAADFGVNLLLGERGGFAVACNRGISKSNGHYVFLVNNDILFTEPTLQMLTDAGVSLNPGVISPRLLYQDNSVQHGGVTFVPSPHSGGPGYFDHIGRGAFKYDPRAYTMRNGLVSGAFFGISRGMIDMAGLLDERFGFTCEDIDYCMRVFEVGSSPIYFGYTSAYHLEGASRGRTPDEKALIAPDIAKREQESMRFFFEKWSGVDWRQFQV